MALQFDSPQHLKDLIKDSLKLNPNDMLTQLQKLPDEPDVYMAVVQLMNQTPLKQQKQALATSLNFLVKRSFKRNHKNPELWLIFKQQIATKKQQATTGRKPQISDWKLTKITQKSFRTLVESFEQQFTPIFQQVYFKLNFNHKILLQRMMRHGDIDQDAKTVFLKETFEEYINLGLEQIGFILQMNEQDKLEELQSRFIQYLKSIRDSLQLLNFQDIENGDEEILREKLSRSDKLFRLVQDCLFLDFMNPNSNKVDQKITQGNNNNNPERNKNICYLLSCNGTSTTQLCLNNVRAVALQIFILMINNYDHKSSARQFDESKPLSLMENLVPGLIQQLSETKTKTLCLNCNEKLSIAMLNTIRKSIQFLFLHRFFSENYRNMFWRIIYPLLMITDEQIRQYDDEPEGFLAQSDSICEKDEYDSQLIESCKTYAAFLLQKIVINVDGSLKNLTEQVLAIMENILSGNPNTISTQLGIEFKNKKSLETCFTFLSLLTSPIKKRKQLTERVKDIFFEYKLQLLSLKKVQKARMIIYFSYNFDFLFTKSDAKQAEVRNFVENAYYLIADSLEQDELLTKCAIVFFESYYNFQFTSQIIRNRLFQLIETTKFIDVLEIISKIIYCMAETISHETMKQIIAKVMRRIKIDNEIYMKTIRNQDNNYSNIRMLKCMETIKAITIYYSNIDNTDLFTDVMEKVWEIFDLMKFISETNYGDDLIEIFNNMLNGIKIIEGPEFFQFLGNFGEYHKKQEAIGKLFCTYLILLQKGQNYLRNYQQGQNFVKQIVTNVMYVVSFNFRYRSMVAVVLLQYIFIKFPSINLDHEWIYQKTSEMLSKKDQIKLNKENISAIFNLWIIGSAISPAYDLGQIDNFSLDFLYGYHARIFAIGIKLKIQELVGLIKKGQTSDNLLKITFLLKKGVEFLKIYQRESRKVKSELKEVVKQFSMSNPNEKIREALFLIKSNLDSSIYDDIVQQLQQDVSRQQLRKMLAKEGSEDRVILKFKIS